jgi:hypothetical protein
MVSSAWQIFSSIAQKATLRTLFASMQNQLNSSAACKTIYFTQVTSTQTKQKRKYKIKEKVDEEI